MCTPITDTTIRATATRAGWRSRSPSTWRCSRRASAAAAVRLGRPAGRRRPRPVRRRGDRAGIAAAWAAARPAGGRRTFGLGRGEIFAALANGVPLSWWRPGCSSRRSAACPSARYRRRGRRGRRRLRPDRQRASRPSCSPRGDREDLNLEGVLRHSAADALGSLGALVAGLVIATAGRPRRMRWPAS